MAGDCCSREKDSMFRNLTLFCLFALAEGTAAALPPQNADGYIDVHAAGAAGDGATDDTQAIAAAVKSCSESGGILYFPRSRGAYITSKTVGLPANCDLKIDGTLQAAAPIDAVVAVGADGTASRHRIFGAGTIDSANLAKRHIALINYAHFEITGVTLLNAASVAGIDVGPQGSHGGYEAYIHDIDLYVPPGVARIAGSAGIWTDTGTDSSVYNVVVVGWDAGIRNSVHNNQPFTNIHVWGFGPNPGWKGVSNLPSVCFDDVAGDAQWSGDECDTPTQFGLHAHSYNDQIIGFSCFNNAVWGSDNEVNCIQFDQAKPYSSVMNSIFQGKSGHRIATDVAVTGDSYAQVAMFGNVQVANVVKTHSTTAHVSNAVIEGVLNVGGSVNFIGHGDMAFANPSGGYRFNVAGSPVAQIGKDGSYQIGSAVVLPAWLSSYAGGANDKSVQLAAGSGAANHLPIYDSAGGVTDSGKTLAGAGDHVPAVANTMGCLDGWDHLPCTVARLTPQTLTSTASTPAASLLTTSAANGVYQVTVTFHSLGGASSGTATPVAVLGELRVSGTAASMTSAGADGISTAEVTLEEGPGVALGYALTLSNAAGAPRYAVSAEAVRLQ
jgi:hypothetical protein